jgi:hypothetical protein
MQLNSVLTVNLYATSLRKNRLSGLGDALFCIILCTYTYCIHTYSTYTHKVCFLLTRMPVKSGATFVGEAAWININYRTVNFGDFLFWHPPLSTCQLIRCSWPTSHLFPLPLAHLAMTWIHNYIGALAVPENFQRNRTNCQRCVW